MPGVACCNLVAQLRKRSRTEAGSAARDQRRQKVVRQNVATARLVLCDRALIGWSAVWTLAALVSFGVVTAVIPNPVFGRGIAPEPFAVAVWLASAPLIGLVMATYFAPLAANVAAPLGPPARHDGTALGTLGGFAAFLAIGCPTCNKIALLLLGASGASTFFGPIQPVIGAVSLALLAGTLAWRLRLRARGGGCAVPRSHAAQP
jgi:hypothetical protein